MNNSTFITNAIAKIQYYIATYKIPLHYFAFTHNLLT